MLRLFKTKYSDKFDFRFGILNFFTNMLETKKKNNLFSLFRLYPSKLSR